jgi:hypothetical protein
MLEINNQLNKLSSSLLSSWALSEIEATQLYVSVPKVRKLYKFLNDTFVKMKEKSEIENKVFLYFTLSQETIMAEMEFLNYFAATTKIIIKGKERNLYNKRQTNSWDKTCRQLVDFENKCKKHMVQIIIQIPSDLTETIASYL